MKRYINWFIIPILILGFTVRLYGFSNPIADWHSWRQADTSAVSRNFVNSGFDVFHPRFDDLSNVPSGVDNPQGYRFVEFPIYNVFQAGFYKLFGFFTIEEWGRLVTIFSSLFSTLLIYKIVKKHHNQAAGLLAAFFYSVLPFSIYYGRTILPDSSTAAAVLGGIYFFDLWISGKKQNNFQFLLAILFTALSLLLKPFTVFFLLPIAYLAFEKFGKRTFIQVSLWIFGTFSLLPLVIWRLWMLQFPEGIPFSLWLFNDGNIRFKGAYFFWIYGDRIGKLILGYFGTSLLILGMLSKFKTNKELMFFYSFIASSLFYLTIVAKGNVQHDYYQILILPTVSIFLGLGSEFLLNFTKTYTNKIIGPIVLLFLGFIALFLSWYFVRDYFNINNPSIVTAGKAVDRLVPKDAKVIANYEGDTTFLYQTNRKGWASYEHDLAEMIKLGADYLVLVHPSESDFNYADGSKIIEQKDDYVIFDLHKTQ